MQHELFSSITWNTLKSKIKPHFVRKYGLFLQTRSNIQYKWVYCSNYHIIICKFSRHVAKFHKCHKSSIFTILLLRITCPSKRVWTLYAFYTMHADTCDTAKVSHIDIQTWSLNLMYQNIATSYRSSIIYCTHTKWIEKCA